MTNDVRCVIGGADTHRDTIHVAAIDDVGRPVNDREFPTTSAGYAAALTWLREQGELWQVGVEGTSSYGAGFATALRAAGVTVVEVDPCPPAQRQVGPVGRLRRGAGRSCRAGHHRSQDQRRPGVRDPRVAPGAMQRDQGTHSGDQPAPSPARDRSGTAAGDAHRQVDVRLGSGVRSTPALRDPAAGVKRALRHLARRYQSLDQEVGELDNDLAHLVAHAAAPALLALPGVGTDVAATVLVTAGDNPERMRSEAAFAHLCGAAPIPASSGRTQRHRLNRGGNRDANRALHVVALTRIRHDARTRAFVIRRTNEGLSSKEIIRCLKRYIAREIYHLLRDRATPATVAA